MSLNKVVTPYEFLGRWNPDGTLSGAHVKWLETVTETAVDGTVTILAQKEGTAEQVAAAGLAGFPLAALLDTLHVTALADVETTRAVAAQVKSDLEAAAIQIALMKESTAADKGELAAKDAQIADLQIRVAAMQQVIDQLQSAAAPV